MAGVGKQRFRAALEKTLSAKQDNIQEFPALLGAFIDGLQTIAVNGQPDYVWCRIEGNTSQRVKAFNQHAGGVGHHFNLPIIIVRDAVNPDIWKVTGRDVRIYPRWQKTTTDPYTSPYLVKHGSDHSFASHPTMGADPVWVFKRQMMPLLPHPDSTGTMSLKIASDFYYFGGRYRWFATTGTVDFTSVLPSGASNARFVTVYIDGNTGNPAYLTGTEFNALTPPPDPGDFILAPSAAQGVPVAAVYLLSGTSRISWTEIYDLRWPHQPVNTTGSLTFIYDEGVGLGSVDSLNFAGSNIEAVVSGTVAHIIDSGGAGGGGGAGIFGTDEGIPIGTGTIIDWTGAGVTASRSGTVINVDIPLAGAGGQATYLLVGIPEPLTTITGQFWRTPGGTAYATGSMNPFIDGISQVLDVAFEEQFAPSGTYRYLEDPPTGVFHEVKFGIPVDIFGPAGPTGSQGPQGPAGGGGGGGGVDQIGVFGTDEGVPLQTGTTLDWVGAGVTSTISGSVIQITIPGGGAGGAGLGVFGRDDGAILGTGTTIDWGYGLRADITGTTLYPYLDTEPDYIWGGSHHFSGSNFDVGGLAGFGSDLHVTGTVSSGTGSFHTASWLQTVDLAYPPNVPGPPTDEGRFYSMSGTPYFINDSDAISDLSAVGVGGGGGDDIDQIGVFVEDEGSGLGTGTVLDFVGAGVDASISGNEVTVTIPGGGGGGGAEAAVVLTGTFYAEEVLYEVDLASSTGSIVVANIPQTFNDLRVDISARTNRAGNAIDAVAVTFNGDAGSNYARQRAEFESAAGFSESDSDTRVQLPFVIGGGDSPITGSFGNMRMFIPDYTGLLKWKTFTTWGGGRHDSATHVRSGIGIGAWKNTSAINRIDFSPVQGTLLEAGTTVKVIGIKETVLVTSVEGGIEGATGSAGPANTIRDDSVSIGEFSDLSFDDGLSAAATGTVAFINNTHPSFEAVIADNLVGTLTGSSVDIDFVDEDSWGGDYVMLCKIIQQSTSGWQAPANSYTVPAGKQAYVVWVLFSAITTIDADGNRDARLRNTTTSETVFAKSESGGDAGGWILPFSEGFAVGDVGFLQLSAGETVQSETNHFSAGRAVAGIYVLKIVDE